MTKGYTNRYNPNRKIDCMELFPSPVERLVMLMGEKIILHFYTKYYEKRISRKFNSDLKNNHIDRRRKKI